MNAGVKHIAAALGAGTMALALVIPALAQAGSGDKAGSASSTTPCDEHFFAGNARENCAGMRLGVSRSNHCDEHFVAKGREDCLVMHRRDQIQRTAFDNGSASSGSSSAAAGSTAGTSR